MAISEAYTNTATIGVTEYSLPNNSTTPASITTDGVYQTLIDVANMAAGDAYTIRVKEKVTGAGTQRKIYTAYLEGAQAEAFVTPTLMLIHGWDVTVQKTAGTDRSFSWSIRQVA